jgi:hypothetical protein
MKYDDASWHAEGDFPADLPATAAATHSGLFLAWAVLAGLASEDLAGDFEQEIEALRDRSASPASLYQATDAQLVDDQLSDEGNAFAANYYDLEKGQFLGDYGKTLGAGLPSTYHVTDTWENFDKLRVVLDARLAAWRSTR